jgi:hypothetical protein
MKRGTHQKLSHNGKRNYSSSSIAFRCARIRHHRVGVGRKGGYSPVCSENFASLIGERGPNDVVRKFRIGPTMVVSNNTNDPIVRCRRRRHCTRRTFGPQPRFGTMRGRRTSDSRSGDNSNGRASPAVAYSRQFAME